MKLIARGKGGMAFDAGEVNPFPQVPNPVTAKEHQQNANHWTYERMRAQALLDAHNTEMGMAKEMKAVAEGGAKLFADLHTAKWVEREMMRKAQKAQAAEKVGKMADKQNSQDRTTMNVHGG